LVGVLGDPFSAHSLKESLALTSCFLNSDFHVGIQPLVVSTEYSDLLTVENCCFQLCFSIVFHTQASFVCLSCFNSFSLQQKPS